MANTANNGIKKNWSLISFAKEFGKPQLAHLTNKETGEKYDAVVFGEGNNITFVSFSRKLGPLSAKEIKEQKDSLQVVLCETTQGNDMYALCHQGESSWEDIDLF